MWLLRSHGSRESGIQFDHVSLDSRFRGNDEPVIVLSLADVRVCLFIL